MMMKEITIDHAKSGKTPQSNKLNTLFEIVVVFLPFILGLVISSGDRIDIIYPGGSLRILGGPITYLGLIISLGFLFVATRLREEGWGYFGVTRPKNWLLAVLQVLGIALAVLLTVKLIINPIMAVLPYAGVQDLSRFDYLEGDLPNLIIMLVNIWITAAFLEEFLFRGYLMKRLVELQGKQSKLAWGIALLAQAVIFGLAHAYQSPVGMCKVGLIGLVFGLSYFATGRNLWPLILAHGLIDSMDMISHFFGG
jgi:CAAX protease family protein